MQWLKINHMMVDFQPPCGKIHTMIYRKLTPKLLTALRDTPVVVLHGARQSGKSTLIQSLLTDATGQYPAHYLTLDDATVLAAADRDPTGFVNGLAELYPSLALDEVQRVPKLFLAIKALVDRDRRPGRFLLTGSANSLFVPQLAESLVGRVEILTLYPFAQAELEANQTELIDILFAEKMSVPAFSSKESRADLLGRLLRGGYPEAVARNDEERRSAWFNSYIITILQRDVRDMANIEGLTQLPRLLQLLAARSSSLLNIAEISREVGLPSTTLQRYMSLLEATFLVHLLPAWSGNLGKRLVKAPKLFLLDTGLLASQLGINLERIAGDSILVGKVLENFVITELLKLATWSRTRPKLFHYRTQTGQEVDCVLEDAAGRVVGIEIKSSATVSNRDLSGLQTLQSDSGNKFVRGIILYSGTEIIPFGSDLWALPLSSLWQM